MKKSWIKKKIRRKTKAEADRLAAVATLPCCVSGETGHVVVHHISTGMGRAKDHFKTIPLADRLHSPYSPDGLHHLGRRKWEEVNGVTEEELLDKVNAILGNK